MNEKVKNISLSVVLGLAIAFSWAQPLDTAATTHVDDGLKRALTSYAISRTLNAVISVAQGTEVSVQVGVGATFAPGQILDPVNDLVEQFGDLMLAASVAFGIMHVVIKIGSFWLFSLLLTISASVWIWLRWRNISAPEWLSKALIVLLFVRFSIPIATAGNDWVFKQFMEPEFNQSLNVIRNNSDEISKTGNEINPSNNSKDTGVGASAENKEATTELSQTTSRAAVVDVSNETNQAGSEIAPTNAEPAEAVIVEATQAPVMQDESMSWKDKAKGLLNGAKAKAKSALHMAGALPNALSNAKHFFETRFEKLRQSVDQLVEHVVKLIVVFILQTIIIPIVFLWMLYRLGVGTYRSISTEKASTRVVQSA